MYQQNISNTMKNIKFCVINNVQTSLVNVIGKVRINVFIAQPIRTAHIFSVPAKPISEGATPCPYWLAPCPIYTAPCPNKEIKLIKKKKKNVIAVCVFSDSRCKNACKMLADLCPCFHQSPTSPNFGRSCVKDLVSFAH